MDAIAKLLLAALTLDKLYISICLWNYTHFVKNFGRKCTLIASYEETMP